MPWTINDLPASISEKDWNDAQKAKFCSIANTLQQKGTPDEKCIQAAVSGVEEKINAKQFPKVFYAKHMKAGLARYEDENGEETILADLDAIQRMRPTAIGKPVYVQHQNVDLEYIHESDGYITESFYNELDGWDWFKILVVSDEGHEKVGAGWSVSNAYAPRQWSDGGTHINVPFDRKLVDGEYTHLAIVPNPRYEEACIMTPEEFKVYQDRLKAGLAELQNSKTVKAKEKAIMPFKLFRNKKEEITNAEDLNDDVIVELNGQEISIGDLKQVLNAKKNELREEMKKDEDKEDKKNKKSKKNEDDDKAKDEEEDEKSNGAIGPYDIDGEEVSLNALKAAWKENKKNAKKNAKKNDDEDSDDMENESEDEEDDEGKDGGKNEKSSEEPNKKNKKEKKNSRDHFADIQNAHLNYAPEERVIETIFDKKARGDQLFGMNKTK